MTAWRSAAAVLSLALASLACARPPCLSDGGCAGDELCVEGRCLARGSPAFVSPDVDLFVLRRAGVALDGRDEDWTGVELIPLWTPLVGLRPDPSLAAFRLSWSDAGLWFFVRVKDLHFTFRPVGSKTSGFLFDNVTLLLDAAPGLSKTDYDGAVSALELHPAGEINDFAPVKSWPTQFVFASTPDGYSLEGLARWPSAFTPVAGSVIGLEVVANDVDEAQTARSAMGWKDATDQAWNDPSVLGRALLSLPAADE